MKKKPDKLYVGITGSDRYEKKTEIKDIIYQVKQKLGDKVVIVSKGSLNGADKYIRKFCLEFECEYEEYSPTYLTRSLYSIGPESYYGKNFSIRETFQRNRQLVSRVDKLIIFKYEDDNIIQDLINVANKKNKQIKVFSYYEQISTRRT